MSKTKLILKALLKNKAFYALLAAVLAAVGVEGSAEFAEKAQAIMSVLMGGLEG